MDKNTKAIEELRKSLNEQKKENKRNVLLEMIYNDEYEQDEDSPGYESVPEFNNEEHTTEQGASGEKAQDEKALPRQEQSIDPEIMEMLSNIRLAVIKGLAKLAQNPDNQYYDIMKKVLTIVDKPIEMSNREK